MKKETGWEIGWYEEKDRPSMLLANRDEYKDSEIAQPSYFDWLQTKNPMGSPIIPVAREVGTGRVVGFVWFVPVRITYQGELRHALLGFNLLVVKEYRNQGIARALTVAVKNNSEVIKKGYLGITLTNPLSVNVRIKTDDVLVSTIPLVIRPLDVAALAKTWISNPIVQWGVRVGWSVIGTTVFRDGTSGKSSSFIDVVEETDFDAHFDRFWEKVKTKYPLMTVRDQSFLQWRFRNTGFRSYQILTARDGDGIEGYMILREAKIRGIRLGLIADFLVAPGKIGERAGLCLMRAATQRFRDASLMMGGGMMLPHTQEYQVMRRAGYLQCPPQFAPQAFTLVAHQVANLIPPDVLGKPATWFISIADHDAV